jgi:hypothetical protein
VVIDESHNFRNDDVYKDRETRYQRLMQRVIRACVKTKVLMLSATPVNNRFSDLKNQLALAYEGEAGSLDDKLKIGSFPARLRPRSIHSELTHLPGVMGFNAIVTELTQPLRQAHAIHTGKVTGADGPKSTLAQHYDFQSLLTLFAPRAKRKAEILPHEPAELDKGLVPGVIFVLRNRNHGINIQQKNRLHPYYLIYMADDGRVVANHTEAKRLLDLARAACKDRTEPVADVCRRFNAATDGGRDMRRCSNLLDAAIHAMIQQKAADDIDSLFTGQRTTALLDDIEGLDDFELINFLVVLAPEPGAAGETA